MFVFLDHKRKPYDVKWVVQLPIAAWEIIRNYNEFVLHVTKYGVPGFVSFDYDLVDDYYQAMPKECEEHQYIFNFENDQGMNYPTFDYGSEKTGYDCAKFLVDFCANNGYKFPDYEVHSMNPVGGKRIRDYIEWAKTKLDI